MLETGKPASATILDTWSAGVARSGNPRIGLELEVRPDDRPPFRVETKLLVPYLWAPLLQPGAVLQVRYDLRDTTVVAVERLGRRRPVGIPAGEVVFDGKTYASVDDMPSAVRRAYEKVQAVFGGLGDDARLHDWEFPGADVRDRWG